MKGKEWPCYRGKEACPKCGSTNTGTDVIATSGTHMTFCCAECRHEFRVPSGKHSALSKRLAEELKILKPERPKLKRKKKDES